MNGKPPFEKLRCLGYDLPQDFALFPPVILDIISTDWLLQTGNDLLAHYNCYMKFAKAIRRHINLTQQSNAEGSTGMKRDIISSKLSTPLVQAMSLFSFLSIT